MDDHPVVREGARLFLCQFKQFEIVGEAVNGEEAVRQARHLQPDVAIMDIIMPLLDGVGATEQIRKEIPHCQILAFTAHKEREYVQAMIRAGASGYVIKDSGLDELVRAIELVHHGAAYFSRQIRDHVWNGDGADGEDPSAAHLDKLSPRERQVLALIAQGFRNKEIASHFSVSVRTVETQRERLMAKLNIHSVAGLTRFAVATRVVPL